MMPNEPEPSLFLRAESAARQLASSTWSTRHREAKSHLDSELHSSDATPCHPLGVKPSGNSLMAEWNLRTVVGNFAHLPDELILLLLEYLDSSALLRFGATCKACYAFTRSEELWKRLFIQFPPLEFTWMGTWRSSYLRLPFSKIASIDCSRLFSDALHRPFYCAHISLSAYTKNIPVQNQIPRLSTLSCPEFQESWANRPFILTEPVREWPIYREWSIETLLKQHAETIFRAEAVDWPLKTYVNYMDNNSDESPLYLFDKNFFTKMGLSTTSQSRKPNSRAPAYWPPRCFGEDFFSVLASQRPANQWLIIGPARSGSTFHKDPNATSAWNAVLRGSKYWIMFPSNPATLPPPPGVYVSPDQSEVTSPLSIAEWLLAFHSSARHTPGCLEGICREGEVLHVPSGWWHLVVNLSTSIAITQNFVPRKHLGATLEFLKHKADQVSGFKREVEDPYSLFVERMQQEYPEILEAALGEAEGKRKRKWDEVVHGRSGDRGGKENGFSFGFGDEGSDVDVP